MSAVLDDDAVQELARRLADAAEPLAEPLPGGESLRALAWALKDLCFAAFNTEPLRTASAAGALRRLREGCAGDGGPTGEQLSREIGALADWSEGAAHITRGHMAEALDSFGRAEAAFRHLGLAGPAAQTRVPRIIALTMLGRHADAADCGEQVKQEFLAQGDRLAAGRVSHNLGSLNMRREAYAVAARQYREAAVLFARARKHELSVMADIGLADALTSLGDFEEALRIYARARMRSGQNQLSVPQALVDESVALLELARGHYRDALAGFEAARRGYERMAMPQHLAIAEKQLADAYLALHLLPEALLLFDEAQTQFQRLDMPYERAWTLAQIGRTRALMGETEAAQQALAAAATLFAEQANPVGEAAVRLTRAEGLLARAATADAEALATASTLAHQAAEAFAEAGLADGQTRAEATLAQLLLRQGRVKEADRALEAALARARALSLVSVQVRCLDGRGGVALARGDEAAARSAFEAAIELFEDQRRALPGDELRRAFLGEHVAPYLALLRLDLAAHERQPSPASAQAVLAALERMRARSLGEHIEAAAATLDDEPIQALRTRLNWLYQRTQRLDLEDEPPAALCEERRVLENRLLESARRQRLNAMRPAPGGSAHATASIAAVAPAATATTTAAGEAAPSLAGLADALPADAALVEYGVLDDELLACVVTGRGVSVCRHLASWAAVKEALKALRFQMETLRHGDSLLRQHLPVLTRRTQARLQQLHSLVWAPLAAELAGVQRAVVVPHAQLGVLPFAALHDGEHALGEQLSLSLAASARLAWRGLSRPPVAPARVLALGESTRLPHAASEALQVASLYAAGPAHIGEHASLSTLQALAGEADVIHLACHGQFRSDNPMFSALHLADAALTVESTQALRLRAATVVLSACDTGLAEQGQGDEMFGLVRAFLVAGASRVVASLWPVDDAVTEAFMLAFHAGLLSGAAPAAALQAAQAHIRQSHPHPFYWAAFVLHGGW